MNAKTALIAGAGAIGALIIFSNLWLTLLAIGVLVGSTYSISRNSNAPALNANILRQIGR